MCEGEHRYIMEDKEWRRGIGCCSAHMYSMQVAWQLQRHHNSSWRKSDRVTEREVIFTIFDNHYFILPYTAYYRASTVQFMCSSPLCHDWLLLLLLQGETDSSRHSGEATDYQCNNCNSCYYQKANVQWGQLGRFCTFRGNRGHCNTEQVSTETGQVGEAQV